MPITADIAASVVDASHAAMVLLDRHLKVTFANRAFCRAFGLGSGCNQGVSIDALGAGHLGGAALQKMLGRILDDEETVEGIELEAEVPGRGRRAWRLDARRVASGCDPLILLVFADVTESGAVHAARGRRGGGQEVIERMRLEEELRAAKEEADRAKLATSRFLTAVSHDLRQPLQSLTSLHNVLSKTVDEPDSLTVLKRMGGALRTMTQLLDTLLGVDKLETGTVRPQPADFPVSDLLREIEADLAAEAETNGLELRVVPCQVRIRSDIGLLTQVIHNLASNAIKYTRSGRVLLGCRRRGASLRIEVWDTGIGIPEDEYESIFEAFYQLDNPAREPGKGFGLGLAVVRHMARLLGHPTDVRSELGKGSVFAVEVPIAEAEQAGEAPPMAVPVEERDRPAPWILFVEDDPIIRMSMEMLLEVEGFRVSTAANGAEALRQLGAAASPPDVVISDYRLPANETGVQVIRRLREVAGRTLPGIILTGDVAQAGQREVESSGCELTFKPIDVVELTSMISRLLDEGRMGSAST